MLNSSVLTIITFFPLLGILVLLLLDKDKLGAIRITALLASLFNFFISLYLYFNFSSETAGMQFSVKKTWIESLGISYHMGIDGISWFLILLTTFLTPLAILSSWSAITEKVKGYYISMLFLETGMIGVFVSLDLFLF